MGNGCWFTVGLEAVAVDNDGLGTHGKLVEGTVHGKDGGVEDVDAVNLLGADDAHRPGHGVALDDVAQLVAPFLGKLLRVVQQVVPVVLGQDDRRSIHAACQTAATSLVAAGLCLSLIIVT